MNHFNMDKETAERLTTLEIKMDAVEEDRKAWNTLIKQTITKTVTWLLGVGTMGILFGWHLPGEVRKWLADWISK